MINEFLTHLKKNRGYSEATCRAYRNDLQNFVQFVKANDNTRRWSTIDAEIADKYVTELATQGYTPASIQRKVSAVRSMYTYMRGKGMIQKNPLQYVSTPKKGKAEPKTIEPEAIKAAIHDESIYRITRIQIAIIAETGVRISELMNIDARDIDMKNRTIRVHGKGNKERTVHFGVNTAKMLPASVSTYEGKIFIEDIRETEYRIHTALRKHSRQQKCSPHVIRHTFATEMSRNGAPAQVIAQLLGHESVKTTEIYMNNTSQHARTAYAQYGPRY